MRSKIYGTFGMSAEYASIEEFEQAVRACLDENDTSNDDVDFTLKGEEFLEQIGGAEWEELEDWETKAWQNAFKEAFRQEHLDQGMEPPDPWYEDETPWDFPTITVEEFYREDPREAGREWAKRVMKEEL